MYFSKFTVQQNDKNAINISKPWVVNDEYYHISLNKVFEKDSQHLTLARKLFNDSERKNVC